MKKMMRIKELSEECGIPSGRLRKIAAADKGKREYTMQTGDRGWIYFNTTKFEEKLNNGDFNKIF